MPANSFMRGRFCWPALIFCLVSAILLYGSWAWWGETRHWWDSADAWVFFHLNGPLHNNPGAQLFWSVASTRLSDMLCITLILLLLGHFVLADGQRHVTRRKAVFCFMVLVLVIAAALIQELVDARRISASLTLIPSYRLGQLVPWLPVKDSSLNSFPSDHGTILFIMTHLLWHFAGRRYGLVMLGIAFVFIAPRLVTGAHWFTDIAVGAVFVSLVTVGLAIYTPFQHIIIEFLARRLERLPIHTILRRILHKG